MDDSFRQQLRDVFADIARSLILEAHKKQIRIIEQTLFQYAEHLLTILARTQAADEPQITDEVLEKVLPSEIVPISFSKHKDNQRPIAPAKHPRSRQGPSQTTNPNLPVNGLGPIEQQKLLMLRLTLRLTAYNKAETARLLKTNTKTIFNWVTRHRITRKETMALPRPKMEEIVPWPDIEEKLFKEYWERLGGNTSAIARALQLNVKTTHVRLKKLGLKRTIDIQQLAGRHLHHLERAMEIAGGEVPVAARYLNITPIHLYQLLVRAGYYEPNEEGRSGRHLVDWKERARERKKKRELGG